MTDYGMPENAIDSAALDRAWTEERVRRANALASAIYGSLCDDPPPARYEARHHILEEAEELSTLLYELGIHLDETAGFNITGYEP